MTRFDFNIKLTPVPKGRPRFTRTGRVYTPAKTDHYERCAKSLMRAECGPRDPIMGGIAVKMEFLMERPKRSTHWYPSRADLDNLIKAIWDAANGVVWKDDTQVIEIHARKRYVNGDEVPGTLFFAELVEAK